MNERRPLTEGLKAQMPGVDPRVEQAFVHGSAKVSPPVSVAPQQPSTPQLTARVPISTRIRAEYADALKRASLQRQLDRVEPNTLQDMLEQALEPWLREHGYIR